MASDLLMVNISEQLLLMRLKFIRKIMGLRLKQPLEAGTVHGMTLVIHQRVERQIGVIQVSRDK
jgi:hypothetical protein